MMNTSEGSSRGKVILTGEHSVGCEQPAVVSSLSLAITVNVKHGSLDPNQPYTEFVSYVFSVFAKRFHRSLDELTIEINSDLPIGCGLGSSAALGHAIYRALATRFDMQIPPEEMLDLVVTSEHYAHGEASGIDPTAVVIGGLLRFQKKDNKLSYTKLPATAFERKQFFLIQSGKPTESTKDMVLKVKKDFAEHQRIKQLMVTLGNTAERLIEQITTDTFDPMIFTENERYLEELGIVGHKAENMMREIESEGGFVKVTGAGGIEQGSGMLLAYHVDSEKFHGFLKRKQWQYFNIAIGTE